MIISDGWDVAHHHIHEAFGHLGQAYRHNTYATQKYRDFEKTLSPTGYLKASMEVRHYFNLENKESIKAVILFQAGMEAWISWAYTEDQLAIKPPYNVVDKWESAFTHVNKVYDFSGYATFYKETRIPIVHPSTQDDVKNVANVWCQPVHEGLKAGWSAMTALAAKIGQPVDGNSWDIMCDVNNAPKSINNNDVSDLQEIARKMNKWHLSEARRKLE